ncbi:MAG: hypothetical protein RLZZ303_2434 [Candidatus Hydrogenedentota bacterium]
MLQLTSKTGPTKGQAWLLPEGTVTVGRESKCDIAIKDPLVSRRHCEILVSKGVVRIRDLGSSNSTFVNGDSIEEKTLFPGDEVTVGNAVLILTRLGGAWEVKPAPGGTHSPTSSMRFGEPIYSLREDESLFAHGKPRSAKDLAELFHTGRALGQAESFEALIETVLRRLREQMQPSCALVALLPKSGEGALTFYPAGDDGMGKNMPRLLNLTEQCVKDRKGCLLPDIRGEDDDRVIETTAIAPLVVAGQSLGALIVKSDSPERSYDDDDLELLIGIAHTVAPHLKAIERLETLETQNERLVSGVAYHGPIIGSSVAINDVRRIARDCARSDLSVLILGETGTGKELVARLIHDLSSRAEKPLVVVNCAAIPDELFESEVFGHEAGAYTGAKARRRGLLEEADGGTLFLDEVGDLSPQNQARLLRAIETGTFRRLGGNHDIKVDVRVLSATNRDLGRDAQNFRTDLYHRLNAFELRLPPLRDRRADIPDLARHFLAKARQRLKAMVNDFTDESIEVLKSHDWTGNIRELRNVVERAVVVAKEDRITPSDLFTVARSPEPEVSLAQTETAFPTLAELEKRHIEAALARAGGNIKAAANLLGIGRSTLYRKLGEYDIPAN